MAVRGIHRSATKNRSLARSDKGAEKRAKRFGFKPMEVRSSRIKLPKEVASAIDFVRTIDMFELEQTAGILGRTRTPEQAVRILEAVERNPTVYRARFGSAFPKLILSLFLLSAPIQARADTMPGAVSLATNPTVKHYTAGSTTPEYTLSKTSFGIPLGEFKGVSFSVEPGLKLVRFNKRNNWITDVVLAGGNKKLRMAVGTGFSKGQPNSWLAGVVYNPKEGTTISAKGFNLQNPDKFWGALMLEQSVTKYFTGIAEHIQMGLRNPENFDVQLGGKFNFGQFSDNPQLKNLSLKVLADLTQKYGIAEFNIENVFPGKNATVIVSIGYQMKKGPNGSQEHYGNLFIAIPFK